MLDLLPTIKKYAKNNPHKMVDINKPFLKEFYGLVYIIRRDLNDRNLQDIQIKLEKLKALSNPISKSSNPTYERITKNIYNALFEIFREMHYVNSKEYDKIIAMENNMAMSQLMFKYDITGDVYNYVDDRHKDIIKLNKSMIEVNQLFVDMACIVDYQGDVVDRIAYRVENAKNDCAKGTEDLVYAYKYKKKRCIIM